MLALSRADLRLLAGSVNETIEAVEDWEFPTRPGGCGQELARQLLSDLADVISALPSDE